MNRLILFTLCACLTCGLWGTNSSWQPIAAKDHYSCPVLLESQNSEDGSF